MILVVLTLSVVLTKTSNILTTIKDFISSRVVIRNPISINFPYTHYQKVRILRMKRLVEVDLLMKLSPS